MIAQLNTYTLYCCIGKNLSGMEMSLIGRGLTIHKTHLFDINRRITAFATQDSWKNAPHATYLYEPDITEFHNHYLKIRERIKLNSSLTFTVVMLKAIAEALKKSPKLNSLLHYNYKTAVGKHHHLKEISISTPWLLPDFRMISPVIHNVGKKTLKNIADDIKNIRRKIQNTDIEVMQYFVAKEQLIYNLKNLRLGYLRQIFSSFIGKNRIKITRKQKEKYLKTPNEDKITSKDIFDASVLVSNLGSVFKHQRGGITLLDLITPQVFAVAINAVQERPGIYKDSEGKKKIGIRKILPLTLTIDHRALDGADFVSFQDGLDNIFKNPKILESW